MFNTVMDAAVKTFAIPAVVVWWGFIPVLIIPLASS